MVYGPFSLAGATAADLQFKLWLNSESGSDEVFWGASTNGADFYGWSTSGYSIGWADAMLDLSEVYMLGNLLGETEVWIALVFESDYSVNSPEGAYVDDIILREYVPAVGQTPPLQAPPRPPASSPQLTVQPATMTAEP
jgi:hypothetical protein